MSATVEPTSVRPKMPKSDIHSGHAGDCTIYSALLNGRAYDGICTCGYGWKCVSSGDDSQMTSPERMYLRILKESFKKASDAIKNDPELRVQREPQSPRRAGS